jgi:serine/threonine protein kinase
MNPDASSPKVQATTDVPLLAGRYQVLDKLGEGGMGAVFLARDTKLDRAVAVKILPSGSVHDAEAVARFQREARALARLSHPGIIQAYDNGADGNQHFLVMEFVQGQSLARELAERGRVSPTRSADYVHQAALALNHAHQNGLIHRDVKPSNLLLAPDGRVKLLDLGLARFLQDQVGDASLTREGTGMGTPDYAAPEQFRDAHKADPRSDVYSLGCTLYHLIAGRVPFPGSSLSEKVQAHETKEPPPLEELCPDVPGGLALAVQRMMAKRPADRFQNMGEVAEALAPYVAGASASFQQLRSTSTWDGSRLATMIAPLRRRMRTSRLIAGVTSLVLLTVGLVGLWAGWFRPGGAHVAQDKGALSSELGQTSPVDGEPKSNDGSRKTVAWYAGDPNVLTVSQQEKDGGKYRTISDALKEVTVGQTILVLDDATYAETLDLTQPSRFNGVTLAALRRATLAIPAGTHVGVRIVNVSGLILRGFRVKGAGSVGALIVVVGQTQGVTLDDLDLEVPSGERRTAVSLEAVQVGPGMTPMTVRNCRFQGGNNGLQLSVMHSPSSGIAVRENTFRRTTTCINVFGEVSRTQIVANHFIGAGVSGIQLQQMSEKTDGLLIANNSFAECHFAVRLADTAPKCKDIRLCNNLVLGALQPDVLFLKWSGQANDTPTAGDGASAAKAWRLDHNWREVKLPAEGTDERKSWVPPDLKKGDMRLDEIKGIDRDPKSSDYLRPARKSPLASAGAGKEDPSLPPYVGALPPEGVDPWDWDRSRKMPKDAPLLTVSKESSGGGKYRSITEALKDTRPWATIRVLDSGTYEEAIVLNDRKKHEGLTLEAVKGATLYMAHSMRRLIAIEDVSDVRVTGFKLTEKNTVDDKVRAFVVVSGKVPGVAFTRLELTADSMMLGFVLQNVVAAPAEPLRIEHCTVRPRDKGNDAISVVGNMDGDPAGGICIRSNRIFSCQHGVNLHGGLRGAHVVGNLIANCLASAVQVEDLSPSSRGLLVANNTAFGGQSAFRVWDTFPYEKPVTGQVEVANNLFFAASYGDVAYILDPGRGGPQSPGNGTALLKLWRFHHNRRDFSGANPGVTIPAGASDSPLKRDELLSMSADEIDRVRPGKDSPLATQGAGTRDHTLPVYIGALPREGDSAWDWDRTWRARVKKSDDKH